MQPAKTDTVKALIIAESLEKRLPFPDYPGCRKMVTESVERSIDSILHESEDNVLQALIIVPYDSYRSIYKHLNLIDYSRVFYQILIVGDETELEDNNLERLYHIADFITSGVSESKLSFIIKRSFSIIEKHFENENRKNWYYNKLIDSQRDQEDLIDIGKSLSAEKDQDRLLRLILYLSKKMTGADAGSIYLVEEDESGRKRLLFKYSHTFSREIPLEEFTMDLNKNSISGYVAVTGEVLNIPDAYHIDELAPYSFNPFFDREHSYISRSMLVVPMRNHIDEIIGVIQLLNSKEDLSGHRRYDNEAFEIKLETEEDFDRYVKTFDDKYNSLLEAIAGQAAIAIENNRLITQIQKQFEEFVRASVSAIESRDPATSGHSFRVAEICTKLAEAVNAEKTGYLGKYSFTENEIRELEFAALLHDFGKVYIDLNIFRKAKKLYPKDLENLKLRLDYLYRFTELKFASAESLRMEETLEGSPTSGCSVNELREERNRILSRLKEIKEELVQLNEPTVTDRDPELVLEAVLSDIENISCVDLSGNPVDILTEADRMNFRIRRGSLNPLERMEIESHVIETYKFVSKIPWPPEYRKIPEIALRHHEKLDGSGYPDGLSGRESTSLQARMMAIADIYDALTAQDRPYKKSVPLDRVLKILKEEAENGKLDTDLVNLFIEGEVYKQISPGHAGMTGNS